MELTRAKQIVSSPAEIDVHYNGVSVWIDKIHDNNTATVHLRRSLEERSEVNISELIEQ